MAEERRLAYVGLTRARVRVTITHCAFRRGFVKPSLFIEDLPGDNIVHGWLHKQQRPSPQPCTTGKRPRPLLDRPVPTRLTDAEIAEFTEGWFAHVSSWKEQQEPVAGHLPDNGDAPGDG